MLDLGKNGIGDIGAEHLANALQQNTVEMFFNCTGLYTVYHII